jgi:hypothetical protein
MKIFQSSPAQNGFFAGAAIIIGLWMYGWRGLVIAATLIAFWGILQFNRATRLLRDIAERPKGQVESVVKMQARLAHGMSLDQVLVVTKCLGEALNERGDWRWEDNAGNEIVVSLRRGVVVRWQATYAIDNILSQQFMTDDDDLHAAAH